LAPLLHLSRLGIRIDEAPDFCFERWAATISALSWPATATARGQHRPRALALASPLDGVDRRFQGRLRAVQSPRRCI